MDKIKAFFQSYEKRFMDGLSGRPHDIEAFAGVFADYFVESSAVGVQGGKNDEAFRKSMAEGYDYYRKIGTKTMQMTGLDVTKINDTHCVAKVHWDATYDKQGEMVRIEFDVWYILTSVSGDYKIFAYVTGDEQKVLREHGLLPES